MLIVPAEFFTDRDSNDYYNSGSVMMTMNNIGSDKSIRLVIKSTLFN
jgi:hypothetical protein